MANEELERNVRRVLRHTPGCCRENALLALADELRTQGRTADADELGTIVERLLHHNPNVREAAGQSKRIAGAPVSADRYYESCLRKYKARIDVESHCREVALKIICRHVDPKHQICSKR